MDLYRLPRARLLIAARGLPARISDAMARRCGTAVAPEPPTFPVRDLLTHGWILLGERLGAELVFGTVTKPWRALGGGPKQPVTAEHFASFSEPGFGKVAESIRG